MTEMPKFEALEDRIVLAGADPDVTFTTSDPDKIIDLGEQDVAFTLTFDNTGTDSGYVPYAEIIIPTSGADGEGDGPSFDSASFLGTPIVTHELSFDEDGEVEHPFLLDATGDPLIVTGGVEGDTLVVFELPYGSFSPGNPAVDIDILIDFSDQADLGASPTFGVLGGFALGCDALDNPDVDPPVRETMASTSVDPQLFQVSKANTGSEGEGATGPNYVYQYILTIDVAPGQTLSDFTLTDTLPPELVYLGNPVISGGTVTSISEPPLNTQVTAPDDVLEVVFAEVSDVVTVTFDYYISNSPSDRATPTNDPTTGADETITNTVTGSGTWVPLDPDDVTIAVSDSAVNEQTAASLAIQKSNSLVGDNQAVGLVTPDDVYEFELSIQVSDYFIMGDLVIEDILGDAWLYIDGSASFTTVEEVGGIAASTAFGVNETSVLSGVTGETTVTFDLSAAMIAAGSDGLLTGDIAGDGTLDGSQTTVTITYLAEIANAYTDTGGPGDNQLSQGDFVNNDVTVVGDVRDNANPTVQTGNTVSDDSSSSVQMAVGQIREKSVYALNGDDNPPADVVIAAGDTVTFSIIYDAPLGAFENFRLVDNLPQLVFDAAEIDNMSFDPASGQPPLAGVVTYGPATSGDLAGIVPVISTVPADNQINFDFGDFTLAERGPLAVELLFTVTVQDAVFAPDLLLTNQATGYEQNSFGTEINSTAIANFDYAEPDLNISKGVIATNGSDPDTALTGPSGLSGVQDPPDASVPRFSGTVTSDGLEMVPVNANIENVNAGDVVTFGIVLENTGRAPNGAFNITVQDTVPVGFIEPAGGYNLTITDGAGTSIGFTRPDGAPATAADFFDPALGLLLVDDGALEGAISAYNAGSGENIIVITYDLLVDANVTPDERFTNTAGIASYNAFEGNGLPFDPNGPLNRVVDPIVDDAFATTESIEISKTLESRQFDGETMRRGGNEVAIGEDLTFLIRVDVPEGVMYETVISDRVTFGGLTIYGAEIVTLGDAMTNSGGLSLGDTATITGNAFAFDFDTLTNAGDNDSSNDFIEIRVFARVEDGEVGTPGRNELLRNQAAITFENALGDETRARDNASVRVAIPNVQLDKSAGPDIVEAGGTVNYSVDITNPAQSRDAPAFDLTLSDTLSPEMTLDVSSISLLVNGTPRAFNATTYVLSTNVGGDPNTFEVFIDRLLQDQSVQVVYEGTVNDDVAAGLTLPNTADLVFDTTPEDDSAADGDDREYSLSDSEEVTTRGPGIDKSVVDGSTSYPETTGTDLGIGELVTYELVLSIPDGSIADVVFVDTLPAGMEYVSSTVVSIGSDLTGFAAAPPTAGTNGGGLATTFDFGTFENTVDANAAADDVNDQIVLRLTARLTADPLVDTSDSLSNVGVLSFTNGDGGTSSAQDTATIEVVEPDVSIDKAVSPATADAGDIVSYVVTVSNDGDGPAYDMIVNDDGVGASIVALPLTLNIALFEADGTTPYTPVEAAFGAFDAGGALQVVIPDLPAGYIAEISYDATVQDSVLFSSVYTNTAEVARYDTNPAGSEVADPADPEEQRNYTGPSATADLTTPDATLDKSFEDSGDPNTAGNALSVGEEVSYLLTISVPQGMADVTLTDNLPAGLLAQSAEIVSLNGAPIPTILINGARDQVVFDFGTVAFAGSDDAAATDTEIVVRVTSIVDNVAAASDGLTLTNTATLAIEDPAGGALQAPVTASETVSVVEPDLVMEKSGEVGGDPGQIVDYSIEITNDGTGPAYDLDITDTFSNVFLTYQAGSATSATAGTLVEPAPGQTDGFQYLIAGPILPGETVTITFQALIEAGAPDAQSFVNTAQVDYDSVPGDPLDADNNPLGRGGTDSDDHTIATVPRITKTPFGSNFTETDSDLGSDPFDLAIGEEVTFRFEITLPEIDLESVIATDLLPDGLEFISATVVNANGTGYLGTLTTTPDNAVPQSVVLDFGAMNNASDGSIGPDDVLVFDLVARVTDGSAAAAGADLTNEVSLFVDPVGDTPFALQTTTAEVRIVEPLMSIDKTGPIAMDPGGPAEGFRIVATNDGVSGAEGPAYDIVIADALPVGLTLDTGSLVFTDGAGNAVVPASVTATATGFSAGFDVLLPGQSVQVDYMASLDAGAAPLSTLQNTATANYDSAPGEVLDSGGAPIEKTYAPVTDTHDIATAPTLEKTAIGSAHTETPEDQDGDLVQDLAIGETVTYELVLTLPEISMDSVVLSDLLPAGLSFVSAEVTALGGFVTVGGGTDLGTINTNATVAQTGQLLTLTLGDVLNADMDQAGTRANDSIVVQIVARVDDLASNTGALPDNSELTNQAGLSITPEGEAAFAPVTGSATVEIVEPELVLEKTADVAVNPGDTVNYSIEIENTGTGPAFDLLIADAFGDPNLTLVPGSVAFAFNGFTQADVAITENAGGFSFEMDDTATGDPIPVAAGETLTITYQAVLSVNAPDAQSFLNTATVGYDSLPGDPVDENGDPVDDRDYTAMGSDSVATVPFLTKTPTASSFGETDSTTGSDPFDLAIGEEVTYTYELYLPEIDLDTVLFSDDLPDGMDFVSFNVVSYGAGITDLSNGVPATPALSLEGNDFELVFDGIRNPSDGTIGPDDVITLEVVGRVTGDVAAGDSLSNTATLNIDTTGGPALTEVMASADVRIVEPELTLDKTGPLAVDPGETARFVIEVENVGPAVVPDATGPAYDVEIEDSLPSGMSLDAGSVSITLNGVAYTPGAGELVTTANSFTLNFAVLLPQDEVVIAYDATLSATAPALAKLTNTVTTAYDSAPGDPLDSDGNPLEKTYDPLTESHTITTPGTLEKTAIASEHVQTPQNNDGDAVPDLAIGETVTYELVLTLPEIAMDSVVLSDLLPTGLSFVSAEITGLGTGLTIAGSNDLGDANAAGNFVQAGQLLTITLGDMLNSDTDGMGSRANDAVVVEIVARVEDIAANTGLLPGNTQLSNRAGLTITPQGEAALDELVDTAIVEVVEPMLVLTKSAPVSANTGDVIDYQIVIENTGTGPAFDLTIADTFGDPNLSLVADSVMFAFNGLTQDDVVISELGGGFSFAFIDANTGIPIPIAAGETLSVTYQALLADGAPNAESFVNTATVDYDSLPGDPVDADGNPVDDRDYSASDQQSVATIPYLVKTPTASSFGETDSTTGSDPFDLAIGEEVTYSFELGLPEIDIESVVFTDSLPAGIEFISFDNVVYGAGLVDLAGGALGAPVFSLTGPNGFTLDFGDIRNPEDTVPATLGADDVITFTVTGRVTDTPSAGDTLTNSATLVVDPDGAEPPLNTATDDADIRVVEPGLVIDKTGPLALDPGDVGVFAVNVTNSGPDVVPAATGPAFDVTISDTIPAGLTFDMASINITLNDAPYTPGIGELVVTATGFTLDVAVLMPDDALVIGYSAMLDPATAALASVLNTATATYDSAPGNDPNQKTYGPVSDSHRVFGSPTLSKSDITSQFSETPEDGDSDGIRGVAVGETVTYRLILTLPEISMDTVVLNDLLPVGLSFVSAEVAQVGSEITIDGGTTISNTGRLMTVTFDDLSNAYVDGTISQAQDAILVDVTARAVDVPSNTDGTQLTNTAGLIVTPEGQAPLDTLIDSATVEIIEPSLSIDKSTPDTAPFLGDTIVYTVVIANEASATSPAFNTVITDNLPDDLELTGVISLSDATLGSVSPNSVAGATALIINIPVLQPGQSLTIEYEAFVGFSTNVLEPITNIATAVGSSSPVEDDPFGRPGTGNVVIGGDPSGRDDGVDDGAAIVPRPVPAADGTRERLRAIGGIDDAEFLPVLLIDPIFTGTAVPGANVTINLYGQDGRLEYVRNIVADTGGHWIAIFPRTELGQVEDDFYEFNQRSVLFDAPVKLLDQGHQTELGQRIQARELAVGASLKDEAYTLGIHVDRPSTLPQEAGIFNTRTYFAPAHIGEIFGTSVPVQVDEIFTNLAGRTVAEMYESSADPLGTSLNRFSYEFLSGSTAVPGQQ